MMTNLEISKRKQKHLGECLIEAGLITPSQLETALKEQNSSGRHLQEILTKHRWIELQTIKYFLEKVASPEQSAPNKKQLEQNNNSIEQTSHTEQLLPKFAVNLSPKSTLQFLFLVILGLCIASLTGQFCIYFLPDFPCREILAGMFNVDLEQNIPSIYSGGALLFCSILLFIIAHALKVANEPRQMQWRALSILFLYLSGDEFMSLHEKFMDPVRNTLKTSGIFHFAWVIPGAIFVVICLLAFFRFILALPPKTRHLFIIAGTIFVSGALGMEMVDGYYASLYGEKNYIYVVLTTIEEFFEMVGIAVFIYALLSYISTHMKGFALKINIINNKQHQSA
jgi:hypothetical protein